MKKIILSALFLSGMTLFACSSDDDNGNNNNDNCVPCASEASDEVCEGENGNAYINGIDTQQDFNDFVEAFCN